MSDWVVLTGNFTGDGSRDHKLFRIHEVDPRIPIFHSYEAAAEHARSFKGYSLIAEIRAETETITLIRPMPQTPKPPAAG